MADSPPPSQLGTGNRMAVVFVVLFDITTVALSTAFLILRLAQPDWSYNNTQLSQVLPNFYFLPLLIVLIVWLTSLILFGVSRKIVLPYLVLPYLFVSVVVLGVVLGILIYAVICLVQFLNSGQLISYEFYILLGSAAVFCLVEVYSFSVKYAAFKNLVKRKKAVHGDSEKPTMAEVIDPFESFSRRSTIIMTDDCFEPPPEF
ncbi:unnamed protein product, partial [Mesorhabditis spiculigera]